MESNEEGSFLNKPIRCKPRGLKQYRKRLVLSGEYRYHPFKRNTKPNVCLSSSKQASVLANPDATFSNSSESITAQQLSQTTVTAPTETSQSGRDSLSCHLGERSSLISECTSSKFLTQSFDLAQVACTLDSAEAYLKHRMEYPYLEILDVSWSSKIINLH